MRNPFVRASFTPKRNGTSAIKNSSTRNGGPRPTSSKSKHSRSRSIDAARQQTVAFANVSPESLSRHNPQVSAATTPTRTPVTTPVTTATSTSIAATERQPDPAISTTNRNYYQKLANRDISHVSISNTHTPTSDTLNACVDDVRGSEAFVYPIFFSSLSPLASTLSFGERFIQGKYYLLYALIPQPSIDTHVEC